MNRNEHDKTCKQIADELQRIADGDCIMIDGEFVGIEVDDNNNEYAKHHDEYYTEYGDAITIDGVEHQTNEVDYWKTATMYDFFDDYYDINYITDSYKEYKACRIMIACGGPNIYVNTWDGCVELYWWTESGKAWLPREVCDEIDDFAATLFND